MSLVVRDPGSMHLLGSSFPDPCPVGMRRSSDRDWFNASYCVACKAGGGERGYRAVVDGDVAACVPCAVAEYSDGRACHGCAAAMPGCYTCSSSHVWCVAGLLCVLCALLLSCFTRTESPCNAVLLLMAAGWCCCLTLTRCP